MLPPQANFAQPAAGLALRGRTRSACSREPEMWERRDGARRAAVSGFGFGGVNAHLLLEEWSGHTRTILFRQLQRK